MTMEDKHVGLTKGSLLWESILKYKTPMFMMKHQIHESCSMTTGIHFVSQTMCNAMYALQCHCVYPTDKELMITQTF